MANEFDELDELGGSAVNFARLHHQKWRPEDIYGAFRDRDGYRQRHEDQQAGLRQIYELVQSHYERLKASGNSQHVRDFEGAMHALERKLRGDDHIRCDLQDERSKRYDLEARLKQLAELSKTTVFVKNWTEDMEAWCAHSLPDAWSCMRGDRGEAYFLFHTMEGATLFTLHFS